MVKEKAPLEHWDSVWSVSPRMKLPSPLFVGTLNTQRLLKKYVHEGMRFVEIGCAPGKVLAWVAASLHAQVAGIDYSERGIRWTADLFASLSIQGELRCEDIFRHSLEPATFDVVFSSGLIEHFDDPRDVVREHVLLAKPGGLVVIAIPNYAGLYGRLQRFFDPANLDIHNLQIMSMKALALLAPMDSVREVRTFRWGRVSPWLINFHKKWPSLVALSVSHAFNLVGLMQPLDIPALCPMLVLEMRRAS